MTFKENEEDKCVLIWNLFQDTHCLSKEHINAYILLSFVVKKRGRYHNVCISLMASGKESRVWGRQSRKNNFFIIMMQFFVLFKYLST